MRLEEAHERGFEDSLERLVSLREHASGLHGSARHLLATGSIESLQAWWMSLILEDSAPLVERVTLMWHDHFATSFDKVDDVRMMHAQNELFREHGLGDFRDLLRRVAKDPAMLVWLDGNENVAGAPNENFAREVMELFGLGIGNYTEKDIREAARAFTGWGTRGRGFHYRASAHDDTEKAIFSRTGPFTGEDAIDLVLEHPACARHVARRLLVEFVMPRPSEEAVTALAATLVDEDWNIEATLTALFRSELFHSAVARRSRIAAPVELIAHARITLGVAVSPKAAAAASARMGQALFRPPSVKGWDGGRKWINASTWLERNNFLLGLVRDTPGPTKALGTPDTAMDSVARVSELLMPELTDGPLKSTLERTADACASPAEALIEVAAVLVTAPESHQL